MKALVTGFHMLYRLSPDSKYPWSGENTGPIEIPVLNIPLLDTCMRARPARDASNGALQHSGRGGAAGAHAQAGQRARALGRRGSSARGCAPWSDCVEAGARGPLCTVDCDRNRRARLLKKQPVQTLYDFSNQIVPRACFPCISNLLGVQID